MAYGPYCHEAHDKWICTERPGHEGPHRAAGDDTGTMVFHQWARPEDPKDCPELGCILAAGHDRNHSGLWSSNSPRPCGSAVYKKENP